MNVRSILVGVGALALFGCAVEAGGGESVGVAQGEIGAPPKVCPAIAIMCAPGYMPKSLPNCHQICVPNQGFECTTDMDCGQIYCFTEPCPQPVCRGHECVLPQSKSDRGPETGVPCGDTTCAPGDYCCNDSCGICAPPDGVCIQLVCG